MVSRQIENKRDTIPPYRLTQKGSGATSPTHVQTSELLNLHCAGDNIGFEFFKRRIELRRGATDGSQAYAVI